MALFQRRAPIINNYKIDTAGLNKTILLVGLGNIGKEYEQNRHNIGFLALDFFVSSLEEMSDWINKTDLKAYISSGNLGDKRVIAIKPSTLMNNSGEAVLKVKNFYKIPESNLSLIHI